MAAQPTQERFLTLASGKSFKLISYGPLNIPENLNYGRTLELSYESKVPIDNSAAIEKETAEVWEFLKVEAEKGGYKTVFLRAFGPYDGKIVIGKKSFEIKFTITENGQWERK